MRSVRTSGLVWLSMLLPGTAAIASIDYGNFNATNVQYQQVTESSTTNLNALYGSPTVSGNAIEFQPADFAASSSGGAATPRRAI
jgi:hypothetical protein